MHESLPPILQLMFGVFAWRLGYIERQQLEKAIQKSAEGETEIGSALVQLGFLSEQSKEKINQLLEDQIRHHGGDLGRSMSSVDLDPSTFATVCGGIGDDTNPLGETTDPAQSPPEPEKLSVDVCEVDSKLRKLELHAEGGLGKVYRAADDALGRVVALKEAKASALSRSGGGSRFLREAQVTARLEHPGIIPVYASGKGTDGTPYYAMRFVDGETLGEEIRQFHHRAENAVDYRSMEFRQLIDRFANVLDAVAYAHSRGVLHRDLKPENVLLGAFGETLVIDWGLARSAALRELTGEGPDEPTSLADTAIEPTKQGLIIGTAGYAPPEQLSGNTDKISERSDVYALGAILYQILVGRPPIQRNGRTFSQIIKETIAGNIVEPRQTNPKIPKSLAAISMKALEPKAEDRYASCSDLANEIQRWLADLPVLAAGESLPDKVARMARRYRSLAVVIGTGVLAVMLVTAGALIIVNGARVKETKARSEAEQLADEKATLAAHNQRVVDHFVAAFYSANLDNEGATGETTALAVLRQARTRIQEDSDLQQDPLAKATLLHTLGESLHSLGAYSESIEAYRESYEIRAGQLGDSNPATMVTMGNLANALVTCDRFDESWPIFDTLLRLKSEEYGPNDPRTLRTINDLAVSYVEARRLEEALPLYRWAREILLRENGPDDEDTLAVTNNLANAYLLTARVNDAIALLQEVSERLHATQGPTDPVTLANLHNLALGHQLAGNLQQALSMFDEVYKKRLAKLGAEHTQTHVTMRHLITTALQAREFETALPIARRWWAIVEEHGKNNIGATIWAKLALADALLGTGNLEEARTLTEEALANTSHDYIVRSRSIMGAILTKQGNFAQAEPMLLSAAESMIAELKSTGVGKRWYAEVATERVAMMYQAWDQPSKASEWLARQSQVSETISELSNKNSEKTSASPAADDQRTVVADP